MPTLFKIPNPTPDLHQESLDPRVIIALFDIGSLPSFSWGSTPSLNNSSHQVKEQQTAQKFENLLREVKDIIKNVASLEENITEAKELFEITSISQDVSELKEKIRGLDKTNNMLMENLFISLEPEKEQNAKKLEMLLINQKSANTVHVPQQNLANHFEKIALDKTQLSKEKAKFLYVPGGHIKLRNNMEQLLQEAEHWSKQHLELSELIKSYQKSQKDIRDTLGNSAVYSQVQPNSDLSAKPELEEQVKKLHEDTHSLHLMAALLANECQILQQRVEILRELHHQEERSLREEPFQISHVQYKNHPQPTEAEKVETDEQNMKEMEGTFQRKDRFYRSLDVCHNKKARNNRFNARIARRALLGRKRPASSLR
ncbi:Spermatogenic leucine zipper protein 1 [Tupaia chinensis]|uniref:Spermatogenic leucine zipper protein 1 n=2 Tax=Tupaia chinensis TaxID=246437 RepID=L9L4Q8_TUPCH|nr:Spermatogenic leucine zipper protein 1 [Tupaia chinensis]